MPHVAAAASRPSAGGGKAPKKCATSSHVILTGLTRLLEGQRRFAEELGLPYDRVFDEECQIFRNRNPDSVLRFWLSDKAGGPGKFARLIDDLVEHNLALCAALDGVAQESISRLGPKAVKAASFSVFGWRPFAWLTFRRLHKNFAANDYLRHQELVVKGFAKAYCSHRESLRKAKSDPGGVSNPKNLPTDKEES
jgi:hypothetical protein